MGRIIKGSVNTGLGSAAGLPAANVGVKTQLPSPLVPVVKPKVIPAWMAVQATPRQPIAVSLNQGSSTHQSSIPTLQASDKNRDPKPRAGSARIIRGDSSTQPAPHPIAVENKARVIKGVSPVGEATPLVRASVRRASIIHPAHINPQEDHTLKDADRTTVDPNEDDTTRQHDQSTKEISLGEPNDKVIELQAAIKKLGHNITLEDLIGILQDSGLETLDSIPVAVFVHKIKTLQETKRRQQKAKEDAQNLSVLEKSIQNMKPQATFKDLINILRRSGLETFELIRVESLIRKIEEIRDGAILEVENLPRVAGIRQKVRDLLDASARFKPADMTPEESAIFATWARPITSSENEYTQEEMHEILYGVLYRGRPLSTVPRIDIPKPKSKLDAIWKTIHGLFVKSPPQTPRAAIETYMKQVIARAKQLFPDEMQEKYNPFTGEWIREKDIETEFHFAQALINQKQGREPIRPPSDYQIKKLGKLLAPYTHRSQSEDLENYPKMQMTLRNLIDAHSDNAKNMLRNATPEDKALILETYFGNFRHRDMQNDLQAFKVSVLLGIAGMHREIGMTYEIKGQKMHPTLTLGDPGSVASAKGNYFLVTHTHPEEYVNEKGEIAGYRPRDQEFRDEKSAVLPKASNGGLEVSGDSRNILFSGTDIENNIKRALKMAKKHPPHDSLMYSHSERKYRNWVINNHGGAQIEIQLTPANAIADVRITYFRLNKKITDDNYLHSVQKNEEQIKSKNLKIAPIEEEDIKPFFAKIYNLPAFKVAA